MKDINNFSRRKFLTNMAKAAAVAPFAGQLFSQSALAAAGYKNVLFFYHPNGVQPSSWNPSRTGSIAGVKEELSFGLGPLKDWNDHIIVFKNIFIDIVNPQGGGNGGGHIEPMKGCLTGDQNCASGGASIDHLIAEKVGNQGVLNVGVRVGNKVGMICSKPRNVGNEQRPKPNLNPYDVATKLDSKVSPVPADPLQKKIYEAAMADLDALAVTGLTPERKAKIEQHRAALETIKNQQQQGTKNFPFDDSIKETLGDTESVKGKANERELFAQFPALCKAQINNIVAAFANNLHQVATLQLSAGDENDGFVNYSFDECWEMVELAKARGLGSIVGGKWEGQHAGHYASHNKDWAQTHAHVRWHNSLLAYTLEQLKAKGILDQTLVVTISEEGDGADHDLALGSIVVASGTGGPLQLGRVIDCGSSPGNGTHKLFGDIAKLMGANITEGPWKSGIIA